MNNQKEKTKRLGALDIFIIFAVLACLVSVGLRFIAVQDSAVGNNVELENYILSFKVSDIRNSSAVNYMNKDTVFYLRDSGLPLGTLQENKTVSDSEKYYYLHDGEIVRMTNSSTGDLYRVDVEGTFECAGTMSADGSFLLNGNRYIALNQNLSIYSKYLAISIMVTGITKG